MLVTVFTDAAFSEARKRAAWAAWIKSDAITMRHSGIARGAVNDSSQAELAALANGIFLAVNRLQLGRGDSLVAESDCEHAVAVLGDRQALRSDRVADAIIKATVDNLVSRR